MFPSQLDKVKDNQVIHRSTIERRSIYRSVRNEDPRYADSIVGSPDYMVWHFRRRENIILTSNLAGSRSSSWQTLHILRRFLVPWVHLI